MKEGIINSLGEWLSKHIDGTMLVTGLIVTIVGSLAVKRLIDSKTVTQKNIKAGGDVVAGNKTTNTQAKRDVINGDKTESN